WSWDRRASPPASRTSRTPTSTSGRPRCSSSPCGSAACASTPTASARCTGPGPGWSGSLISAPRSRTAWPATVIPTWRSFPRAPTWSRSTRRRDVRRGRRRGRIRRALHAPPLARPGLHGPGVRGRRWRRRHVVLEPLSGRALRRREHGLLVLVLGGAAAGVALDRALLRPAGDLEVREPRGGPLRPATRHPVRHARDDGRLRRGDRSLAHRDRPRRPRVGALLHHG